MPVPKPSSDNYEYPSDAGIMGEDYENDQARFKEVTDKELEMFQTTMQKLETVVSSRLRDAHDAAGGVEAAISRLLQQVRREKDEEPDTLTAEGVAKILGDFANRSSARSDKELVEELGKQHRTIQQAITRIFVEWMRHLHGQAGGNYDARNEASVMLAIAMVEHIAPERLHLPLL